MKAQLAKKVQEVKNIFVEKPYRIGIAMSGGGIKGLAHAGALKALEEYVAVERKLAEQQEQTQ